MDISNIYRVSSFFQKYIGYQYWIYRSGVIRLLYYRQNYSMLSFEFWEF